MYIVQLQYVLYLQVSFTARAQLGSLDWPVASILMSVLTNRASIQDPAQGKHQSNGKKSLFECQCFSTIFTLIKIEATFFIYLCYIPISPLSILVFIPVLESLFNFFTGFRTSFWLNSCLLMPILRWNQWIPLPLWTRLAFISIQSGYMINRCSSLFLH